MKVTQSIRRAYESQYEKNSPLKQEVDEIFTVNKQSTWFYASRIKTLQSFALKLETGRFENPSCLEDFFGCMLVVENSKSIQNAVELVNNYFLIEYRRPESDNFTSKDSHSFLFDDLRLYAKLKQNLALPPKSYGDIIFEIQIKTFLQHAWSIATHDLIYKSDNVDWARERIAYQIKAMLEHAEISILEVDNLAKTPDLDKRNKQTELLIKIVDFFKSNWSEIDLPDDIIRLARNIKFVCESLEINFDDLVRILNEETELGRGAQTKNLSPYLTIIQSIYNQSPDKLKKFINSKLKRFKIFIPEELEISSDFIDSKSNNVITLNNEPSME